MAYSGATSTAQNMPSLVTQTLAWSSSNVTGSALFSKGLPRTWIYSSSHTSTEIMAANFFVGDAKLLGIQIGDLLMAYSNASSGVVTTHKFIAVGATTAQVSTGIQVGTTA